MATFGITTPDTGTFPSNADRCLASEFVCPTAGTMTSASLYIGAGSGTDLFKIVVWTNGAGVPGAVHAVSAAGNEVTSAGWVTVAITGAVAAGTTYWISAVGAGGGGGYYGKNNSGSSDFLMSNGGVSYANPASTSPWPGTDGTYDGKLNAYVTYTESGGGDTIESRTVSSAGAGAASFTSQAVNTRTVTSAGVAAATWAAAGLHARTISSAGVAAAAFTGASVLPSALSSAGVAAATWQARSLGAAALSSAGAGAASWTAQALGAVSLSSTGIAAVAWDGVDAAGGLTSRTFASAGAATAAFTSQQITGAVLAAAGIGAFAPQSAQIELRTLLSAGVAAAPWIGTDGAVSVVEARSLSADGAAAVNWVGLDSAASVSLGGRSKRRPMGITELPVQIREAKWWPIARATVKFEGEAVRPVVRGARFLAVAGARATFAGERWFAAPGGLVRKHAPVVIQRTEQETQRRARMRELETELTALRR